MKFWTRTLLITIVFLVSLFLRTHNLSERPIHLSMDEASIGYNAYSILKTGLDEWGEKLPLAFTSVGDYKPPVNVYLTIPSIYLFGLDEFSVRFPTALLGSISVIVFIFLLIELKLSFFASLIGGLWLAVLPWHIHFSRGTFEAVTALFFLLLGTQQFLVWKNKHHQLSLYISIVSFSLSVWSYHSARLFVPLFVLSLLFIYKKDILHLINKKNLSIALITLLFFAIPFINLAFFTPAIRTRAAVTSILREQSLQQQLHHPYQDTTQAVFDNNNFTIFRHWSAKYLNYFDLKLWFWKAMQFTPQGYPDLGLLLLVDVPFLIFGTYSILNSKDKKTKLLTLSWFILGPLPASITMNEQHPLRALTWLPAFGIIIAFGADYVFKNFTKFVKIIIPAYFVGLIFAILYFLDIYFNQFPYFYSEYWQYGYKQISQYACQNRSKYDQVFISDTFGSYGPLNTGTPYIYYLFYCQYDPATFIKDKHNIVGVDIRRTDWKYDSKIPALLIAASPWDILDYQIPEKQIIKRIDFLNGKPGFLIIETNSDAKVQK